MVAVDVNMFGGTTVIIAVIFIACAAFTVMADSENCCKCIMIIKSLWMRGAGQV